MLNKRKQESGKIFKREAGANSECRVSEMCRGCRVIKGVG